MYGQGRTKVVLDYAAPPECPLATTFQRDIASRLPEGRSVDLGALTEPVNGNLGLQVRVSKTPTGYRAELTTFTDEGRSTPRSLEGPVCSELMDAMAFTAALTVDPNATLLPTHPETSANGAAGSTASGSTRSAAEESKQALEPETASGQRPATPTREAPDEPPVETVYPPHVAMWASSLSGGVVLTAPVSPGVSPGLLVSLRHSDEAPGAWSPAVGVALFGSQLVSSYSPNASFAAFGAHLEFCPSSFRDRSVTIRPCAAGELTMLRASGENLTVSNRVTVAVPSVGGHVELRHTVTDNWFVTGVVGAQLALQRHRFDVGLPAEAVATTRAVAPFVSFQLGAFL